ncbi:MAG: N-acetylglucosamine kinase [Pyrinomonadaceae bacterium]
MKKSKIQNSKSKTYLGVDGGQSHTEAIIADESGRVLGRGTGGASNHAEIPGGRSRLENAIKDSVGKAIREMATRRRGDTEIFEDLNDFVENISAVNFASAHCGMTGGAIYKEEIIARIIKAKKLTIGHDAPTALFGATAGKPGIVVIAGTGSVVFGVNEKGETARAGGLGYLFADEGGGFWLAAQMIRLAIKEQDGLIEKSGILKIVLDFFGRGEIREVTDDFYNGKISRDEIAKLAKRASEAADGANEIIREQINFGAEVLAASVESVARKLNFRSNFPVAGVGGMFRARLMRECFKSILAEKVPAADFIKPRFGPAEGALLLAYRQAEIEITADLLKNLEKVSN